MKRMALAILSVAALATTASGDIPSTAWSEAARFEFEYRVNLNAVRPGRFSVWVPYPSDNDAQKVLDASVKAPWPLRLTSEKRFGNRIAYLEGKGPLQGELLLRFLVERRPFSGIPRDAILSDTPLDPARYLGADRLVPLGGRIRELALEQGKNLKSPAEKARAYYDYVVRTMTYNKEGTGWGRGDAVWACERHRGNCTDFHSLFIAMARSAGIPARFVIGFPIPADQQEGSIPGYHCWAEYYDPGRGWQGVDASEAWKKRLPDAYFNALPNDRIEFAVGRDLILEPPQRDEPLNYFIYPYAEVDGKPLGDISVQFHFRKVAPEVSTF